MLHHDQAPDQGSQPPARDPESVYRSYLEANALPAIGAAAADRLRRVLLDIAGHLCRQLCRDLTEFLPSGPAPALSWGICEAGSATRAGFQLYHYVGQVIAAGCLHALGFDPHAAADDGTYLTATIAPALATASRDRMRILLLDLNEHIQVSMDDADTSADGSVAVVLPDEAWEAGAGTAAAIGLYRHATLIQSAHVLNLLWDGLGTRKPPALRPFTAPAAGFPAISPN